MGHWYTATGEPMHQIMGKKGSRATTLRDARKVGLVPSVTEILKVQAAPQLERWKMGRVAEAAFVDQPHDDETLEEYKSRIIKKAMEPATDSADIGADIHNDIERVWLGKRPMQYPETAYAVHELVIDLTGEAAGWIPEETFATALGFGGMVDLYHPSGIIIDYKTKDFDDPEKRMAYDDHQLQLSAYAMGLGMPDARLINIFVSRTVPGLVVHHEWEAHNYHRFDLLLKLWQDKNEYKPTIIYDNMKPKIFDRAA